MRLYMIYKICKKSIPALEQCEISDSYTDGQFILKVNGWISAKSSIEQLYSIEAFKEIAKKIYESVPVFYRNVNQWQCASKGIRFGSDMRTLIAEMGGVIKVYESFGYQKEQLGIDIKMPQGDFRDFAANIKALDYIFTQCPLLKVNDGEIKFSNVDVGSTWLTFFIVGAGATILAKNIAALVDKAIAIKSHLNNIKQQEELIRSSQTKNEILEETKKTFDILREAIIEQALEELQSNEVKIIGAEEKDKAKLALEKLAELIDKGMGIYASIDTPDEIQVLFPEVETERITDNVTKLLTENEQLDKDK